MRIAVVCGVFAVLRFLGAQVTVSSAIRQFSHSAGLTGWARPGPYLVLFAAGAAGLAAMGLLFFHLRALHPAILLAGAGMILLGVLAVAHSASLYWTAVYLQAPVGALTVSRIIEAILLLTVALAGAWFIVTDRATTTNDGSHDGRIRDSEGDSAVDYGSR
jgi:hypothetical protein